MNKSFIMKRCESLLTILLIGCIALIPLLTINKGIDVSDTGFIMSRYKYVFSDNKLTYATTVFSDIIGGLVYHIFPKGQLLTNRLCTWLSYLLVSFLCYQILKGYAPKVFILAGILVSSFFCLSTFPIFSYHNIHVLFFCLGIFLIYKGLRDNLNRYIAASGAILAFNIFVRFPNILQLLLICVIVWYYGFCLQEPKQAFKKSCVFLLSAGIAFAICAVFSICFLGWDAVRAEIARTIYSGSTSGSSHNVGLMFQRFFMELWEGCKVSASKSIWILLGWGAFQLTRKIVTNDYHQKMYKVLGAILTLAVLLYSVKFGFVAHYNDYILMLAAFTFVIGAFCIFRFRKAEPLFSAIILISCIVVCVEPLGTDNGLPYIKIFMHFFFPALICMLYKLCVKNNTTSLTSQIASPSLGLLLGAFILIGGLVNGWIFNANYVYRDRPYNELTSSVSSPVLYGMKTTPLRASQFEAFIDRLTPYYEYNLFAYGNFALAYCLVPMEPVTKIPWPDLRSFPIEQLSLQLEYTAEINRLPVIVMAHIDDMAIRGDEQDENKRRFIQEFLDKNHYQLFYEDDYFKMYSPS